MSEFLKVHTVMDFKELVDYISKGNPDPKLKIVVSRNVSDHLRWDDGELTGKPTLVWDKSGSSPKLNSVTVEDTYRVVASSYYETPEDKLANLFHEGLEEDYDEAHDEVWAGFEMYLDAFKYGTTFPDRKHIKKSIKAAELLIELSKKIDKCHD